MCESFEFFDVETCTKIVAESTDKVSKVGDREIFFEKLVFDADENFLLGGATGEIAASGAVAGTGKAEGLFAVERVFDIWLEDSFGIAVIINAFVKGNIDAAEDVDNLDKCAPVEVGVILKIDP